MLSTGGFAITQVPVLNNLARTASDMDVVIGTRLRFARRQRGLSRTGLADLFGITFQQVQKYESGLNRVGAVTLFVIAEKLALPLTYFYEEVVSAELASSKALLDNHHQIYLTTTEGQRLIDAFRGCSENVRRKMILLMRAAALNGTDGKG